MLPCSSTGLFDGAKMAPLKQRDPVWNAVPEPKTSPGVERVNRLLNEANAQGEEMLASRPLSSESIIADAEARTRADVLRTQGIAGTWCMNKAMTLSENMRSWASKAHWQVKWQSDYDYPLEADFCISGSYLQALDMLAQSYSTASRVLRLDVYPRQSIAVFSTK